MVGHGSVDRGTQIGKDSAKAHSGNGVLELNKQLETMSLIAVTVTPVAPGKEEECEELKHVDE